MAKIVMKVVPLPDVVIAAAGTPQRLSATSLEVSNIILQWHPDNTGRIFVGDADVDDDHGVILSPSFPIMSMGVEDTLADEDSVVMDLTDIWVDTDVNGSVLKLAYMEVDRKIYNE